MRCQSFRDWTREILGLTRYRSIMVLGATLPLLPRELLLCLHLSRRYAKLTAIFLIHEILWTLVLKRNVIKFRDLYIFYI